MLGVGEEGLLLMLMQSSCAEFVDTMIGGHPIKILPKEKGNDQIVPLDAEEIE